MSASQTALLADLPSHGRYVFFELEADAAAILRPALQRLSTLYFQQREQPLLVGLGQHLLQTLQVSVPGMKNFESLSGENLEVVSTPSDLWCWLRADNPGDLVHLTRRLQQVLAPALRVVHLVDAFRYGTGRDLTGFEDGTENPQGQAAVAAAVVQDGGPGLAGGSFVAVQQWLHDLDAFDAMSTHAQNHMVGRQRDSNEEIDDAPASAHVKRTAQESFLPEAFVLRRSMPWASGLQAGLMFVAFGKSFHAFEAQLKRMLGLEDGVVDALFGISKPIRTSYYWCPPVQAGHLDLRHLNL